MASITVNRPDLFPAGTSVSAYLRTAFGVPSSGAPYGSAVETENVAGDGTLTLDTLTSGTSYVLHAASPDRYLSVNTSPATSTAGLPTGGSTGQALVKASEGDGDVEWATGSVPSDATAGAKGIIQLAGDLSGTAASPQVAAGAIGTSEIADNAVTTAKIAAGQVTAAKVAADVATQAELDGKADLVHGHDADAVTVTPFGAIVATDVQAALEEIVTEGGATVGDGSITLAKLAESLVDVLPATVAWDGTGDQPARPAGFPVVFWVCPVNPEDNALDNDVWISTATP